MGSSDSKPLSVADIQKFSQESGKLYFEGKRVVLRGPVPWVPIGVVAAVLSALALTINLVLTNLPSSSTSESEAEVQSVKSETEQ